MRRIAILLVLAVPTFAAAHPPVASYIFPAGGQRGTKVNVPRRRPLPPSKVRLRDARPRHCRAGASEQRQDDLVRRADAAVARIATPGGLPQGHGRHDRHRGRRSAGLALLAALDLAGGDAVAEVHRRRFAGDRRGRDRRRSDTGQGHAAADDQWPNLSARGHRHLFVSAPARGKRFAAKCTRLGSVRRSMPAWKYATRKADALPRPTRRSAAIRCFGSRRPPTANIRFTSRTRRLSAAKRMSTA